MTAMTAAKSIRAQVMTTTLLITAMITERRSKTISKAMQNSKKGKRNVDNDKYDNNYRGNQEIHANYVGNEIKENHDNENNNTTAMLIPKTMITTMWIRATMITTT